MTFALLQLFFSPVLGSLSDRFGRRPVLVLAMLGFALSYLLLALADSLWMLFLGRALAGLTGASVATAMACAADLGTHGQRTRHFGWLYAGLALGMILGPALGGLLAVHGTTLPLLLAAGLCLLNALLAGLFLEETLPPTRRRRLDPRRMNALRSISGLARQPGVGRLLAVLALVFLGLQAVMVVWPFFVIEKFHWSSAWIGYSLALYGVLAVLAQTLGVNLCKRRLDDARLLRLGLALQGCGLLLFALVDSSFWLVCALLPFALGSLATPAMQGLLGPRAGRPPGRVAGRAEQPDEPRRDRRSAADERPVPLGQRSARAAAPGRRAIPRRRPSRSGRAGPGLATSTYGRRTIMDRIDMGVLVVLFNPGDDDLEHLGELAAAFPQLRFLAVDNSPHSDPQRNARLRGQGIAVLHHGNRQGIAGAFNQGLDALFRRGVQGVLLLDQDSRPGGAFLAAQWRNLQARNGQACLLGPRIFDRGDRRFLPAIHLDGLTLRQLSLDGLTTPQRTSFLISSGCLLTREAYQRLGHFDEELFIDHVDTEYSLRAQALDVPLYVDPRLVLEHRIGTRKTRRLGGLSLSAMNHAPLRRYYLARNGLLVLRRYARSSPLALLANLPTLTQGLAVLLLERDKLLKLRCLGWGLWDGLRGRGGALETNRPRLLKRLAGPAVASVASGKAKA